MEQIKFLRKFCIFFSLAFLITSCKNKEVKNEEEVAEVKTPVTITSINIEPIDESIELNAVSSFLQKWIVRANATGYLKSANVQLNKTVNNNQILYSIKTKEAQSIGNSINILDSTFKFSGINSIKANGGGFISQINHQNGDYVQDGEQLAVITDTKSFVFLLDMPYELRPYIINKKNLELTLPDGEKLMATVNGNLPTMDMASQTQSIILKVSANHPLPENLIAKVHVLKSFKPNAITLPKASVLTNETQSEFWVMKMINDSIAAKMPIKKGIETSAKVEILSPSLSPNDKILLNGNYGLSDTAKVKIVKE